MMKALFFDTETNGLDLFKHHIIDIAFRIVDVNSGECLSSYESYIAIDESAWQLSDRDSLKVNGRSWEDIADAPKASVVIEQIQNHFEKHNIKRGEAAYICQNPSFDRGFFSKLIDVKMQEHLQWPYHWLDLASMFWALGIKEGRANPAELPWKNGFTKDKIAKKYGIPSEAKPHRAMGGVDHLILCYKKVVGFPNITD